MIDVLKRLAEIDANSTPVEPTLKADPNLATVKDPMLRENIEECGMMMPSPAPQNHNPASFSISANSGDEIASMLHALTALAGMKSPDHKEIEVSTPHVAQPEHGAGHGSGFGGDIANMIDIIDKNDSEESEPEMDDDEQDEGMLGTAAGAGLGAVVGGPVGAAVGGVAGDALGDKIGGHDEKEEESMYATTPNPKIEPHDYGDKKVTPKPQGLKQRVGDNPYKPASESIESMALQLLKDYKDFVAEAKKPSAGLSKAKKSAVVKKAKAGKDIGKKGKGFEKVAAKAAKKYGSEEKGKKVAAAAMWKNIKR